MKKFLCLFSALALSLTSCSSSDELKETNSSVSNNLKVMNFTSNKNMQDKIDEIMALKDKKESVTATTFFKNDKTIDSHEQNLSSDERLIVELKKYHTNVLNDIYDLRNQIGFVSIQSIADEINSLKLINPAKANQLTTKYKDFLNEHQDLTVTIFNQRLANVINLEGEVIVDGKKILLQEKSKNIAAKYLRDESIITGVAASEGSSTDPRGLKVYYNAGREVHENDLGIKFYRYYTEMTARIRVKVSFAFVYMPIPITYEVNPGSIAGFVQAGSNPFSEYAFTYDFISGYGSSVRNTGGPKNTLYKPAGGNLSATFTYTTDIGPKILTCDFSYDEQ